MSEIILSIISIFGTISTIIFYYLTFIRNHCNDSKTEDIDKRTLLIDIGIDGIGKKLNKTEVNYYILLSRAIKVEESYISINQGLDKHISHREF